MKYAKGGRFGALWNRAKERTRLAGAPIGPKTMRAGVDRMPRKPGVRIIALLEPACSLHVADRVGPRGGFDRSVRWGGELKAAQGVECKAILVTKAKMRST
jgi:hypothetical protein